MTQTPDITPEAVEVAQTADDGRPMVTDLFLVKLLDSDLDDYSRVAAIRDWIEGDWVGAMEGIEE
jgi:hypothetical protein